MKKWLNEWHQAFNSNYQNSTHLMFQLSGGVFILSCAILYPLTKTYISEFWNILLIMIIPAICGYFSSKHSIEKVRTYLRKFRKE